jgi:hypothetical protein
MLVIGLAAGARAHADCQCVCMDGEVQAICSSAIAVAPVCAPRVCPVVPPSVQPIQLPRVPPVGATECTQRQVLDDDSGQYLWTEVCE